ncbi:MAG: methyltransferase type 12, partial [Alishewanella sp. 32-51-5]
QRSFIEAGLSLPNISAGCRDFAEVLHAMQLQMIGIKQRLQVAEW